MILPSGAVTTLDNIMSKTGRNDPCPCGSGKKYKKCCLVKEEGQAAALRQAIAQFRPSAPTSVDETADLFEDAWPATEAAGDEDSQDTDIEAGAPPDTEPYESKPISDEVPAISEEDKALVDAWWSDYLKLTGPDAILRHLNAFLDSHPRLVENLQLHYEVLFELGGALLREGRPGDYIELLERIRRDFPASYLKSFSYYDRDLICYRIATRGPTGIEEYLDWFREYPDEDIDGLLAVVDFMMAAECDETLIGLAEAVYDPICRSTRVMGGCDRLLTILILAYCRPYLDGGWTRPDLEALAGRLRTIRTPLREEWYRPEVLDGRLGEITGVLDQAFFDGFHTRRDLARYYTTVSHNFMGWLHRERGFSWMKAEYYRTRALSYLVQGIPDGKRPKQPFTFHQQLLDQAIGIRGFMPTALPETRVFATLNALYWFADYLAGRAALPDEQRAMVQEWCQASWHRVKQSDWQNIETLGFERFPQ